MEKKFFAWRDLSDSTSGSVESPSHPQFQELLSLDPSVLFSRLA